MFVANHIKSNLIEFKKLCESHRVTRLYAFGSSSTKNFRADSDVDLLIELDIEDPIERGLNLMDIWDRLERFFQRKVDLLTHSSVRNPELKKNIDANIILIYNREKEKISL